MAKDEAKNAEKGGAAKLKGDPGTPEALGGLLVSPCLQRGKEIPYHPVVHSDDRIEAVFGMCSSPGDLFVFVDPISLTAQPGPPVAQQAIASSTPIAVSLTGLPVGRYVILWKYAAFAPQWDVFAELVINGTARFRRYQTSNDAVPASKVFITLEVMP